MKTTDKETQTEKILGIDTSQKIMTVLFLDGTKKFSETVEGEKNHSALILPAIDRVLKSAGAAVSDIGVFCCVTGPGSFTGLRVGLATLKGLSFGRNTPYITVNTKELRAYYETNNTEEFFKVIESKVKAKEFISAHEVLLHYEDEETKRFRY